MAENAQRLHKLQNVSNEKANIENAQNAFARRFVSFAIQHNFPCTERQALDLVSCFLDDQQIAVLLDEPPREHHRLQTGSARNCSRGGSL